jgi:hypothetical protein
MKLYLDSKREGYDPEQCGGTMTVGELVAFLEGFDENTEIYIRNDGGYTYGSITADSFEDDYAGGDYE